MAFFALAGCAAELPPAADPRVAEDALSHIDAKARSARIRNVTYRLHVDLAGARGGSDTFSGEARLRFELTDTSQALTVDFSGAKNLLVTLNGERANIAYNGYFLTLPRSLLRRGFNELFVAYVQSYGRDGTGLHRFVDPEDGETYLYTYLWPYYANRLLPLFDQPDIKARYELEVRAPRGWSVVSTSLPVEQGIKPGTQKRSDPTSEDGTALWSFAPTPPISSYVFSLHAGPYQVWEDTAGAIPLRLMARKSLAPHVAVDEWFALTRNGLDFFADYFEVPYPFSKYDQLVVPDFNIGAMENIAAVTFNEQYVQRQASTYAQREGRAEVILHEMAHMWFGNLVTHAWWNGLWLNESFATQMSHLAMAATTPFVDAWHRFFTLGKQRAYYRDSRVTTHPVEMPIGSTADFFTVFDAITYEKGSSALKQLAHFVGAENYRRGVSEYLQANAFATTELADFIASQSRSAARPLDDWALEWLGTAGFNELAAGVECTSGELAKLTVGQAATPAHPTLRAHRLDIALYAEDEQGRLRMIAVVPAEVQGPATGIDVSSGLACPLLVFPNHDDWTYAKVAVTDTQLRAFAHRIQEIPDPLARSMLLQVLADRARAGQMSIAEFMEIAAANAEVESDFVVLSQLTGLLADFAAVLERLGASAELNLVTARLETLSWRQAESAPGADLIRLWFGLHMAVARSDGALQGLVDVLDGRRSVPGLEISQDLRWQLLVRLSARGFAGTGSRVARELQRDPSEFGAQRAIAARAAQPDLAVKRRWIREIQDPASKLGLARKRTAMFNLFPANQTGLQQQLLSEILDPLPQLSRDSDHYYTSSYVEGLLAPVCSSTSAQIMAGYLDAGLNSTALRFLREARQADAECARLRDGKGNGKGNGIR